MIVRRYVKGNLQYTSSCPSRVALFDLLSGEIGARTAQSISQVADPEASEARDTEPTKSSTTRLLLMLTELIRCTDNVSASSVCLEEEIGAVSARNLFGSSNSQRSKVHFVDFGRPHSASRDSLLSHCPLHHEGTTPCSHRVTLS